MGVHDTLMNVRNDGIGVCNTPMNIRNNDIRVYRKLGLEVGGQPWSRRSDGTYVEDVEDPVEVQPPGRDRPLIVLRVKNSRDRILSTPLDDAPLDLGHSPAIANLVSEWPGICIIGSAHVVNCSIASKTDWLSSSIRLPFIPRSRALQTSAQINPSST